MLRTRNAFFAKRKTAIACATTLALLAQENALKEQIINAEKALQTAQNKDMSSILKELNDKRARLDEIDIFLGRVEPNSPAVERAIARYGDEYKAIIADKFAKEDAQSGASDIVFAPKRENLNKIQVKNGIMSAKKQGNEMTISITTQGTQPTSELRANARQVLDNLVKNKTQIINKNDGRVAVVSGEGRNKILSGEALRKSRDNDFSKEAHFAASQKIKELFENAVYYASEMPRNNSTDIKNYHKYIAKLKINNKPAQAFLTLKELVEHGNKIYSLELQEIRPLP